MLFNFFPSLNYFINVLVNVKYLKKGKVAQGEAPLSHRKHCSPVDLLLIFMIFTVCHHVTDMLNLCPMASLASKNGLNEHVLLL